ncbi:MAG: M48 family metallopeptidase [Phycisphaerales bacterium]|nr:M48 family metallopeptidase [Phycisphaerales bacterium]MCI0630566.1 M48 family metallopeptidase [Phycisphaerales bacterium]MCI0675997.1 M48 family metallopeptidase [Phycisphaerales bacterium]
MQLVPLLLVAVVMAVDEGLQPIGAGWGLSEPAIAALAIGPNILILALAGVSIAWRKRQLSRRGGSTGAFSPLADVIPRVMVGAERDVRIARALILVNHAAAVLVFGWVGAVRALTGDLILIDEVIAILPPLLGLAGTWWIYYPVERRLREAILTRRLDEGLPIYPPPSRLAYVVLQARLQLLLLLTPVLVIVAAAEAIDMLADLVGSQSSGWASVIDHGGTLVAAAVVFLLSPYVARLVLDVQPLPTGELREALEEVCRRHRVKVRQLLLWNTHGSMINAAVMGLIGPIRYILITDALIEMLRPDQVRAVMAHEIGHVRRHHMPWLIVCLMAAFLVAAIFVEGPLRAAYWFDWIGSQAMFDAVTIAANVAQLAVGLTLFGWICRRFERQADTFAVQHLSGLGAAPNAPASESSQSGSGLVQPITPEAVDSMRGALDAIARLNTVDRRRSSWRHGSIAWRIEYLYSIVGRPVMNLPIDRLIRWIKTAAAVVLITGLGLSAALQWRNGGISAQMRAGDNPWRVESVRAGDYGTSCSSTDHLRCRVEGPGDGQELLARDVYDCEHGHVSDSPGADVRVFLGHQLPWPNSLVLAAGVPERR